MSIRLSYINWILRPWQIRINKLEGIGRALYRDKHEQDIEKLGKDKGGNKKYLKYLKKQITETQWTGLQFLQKNSINLNII